jgi:hypothetical protein
MLEAESGIEARRNQTTMRIMAPFQDSVLALSRQHKVYIKSVNKAF